MSGLPRGRESPDPVPNPSAASTLGSTGRDSPTLYHDLDPLDQDMDDDEDPDYQDAPDEEEDDDDELAFYDTVEGTGALNEGKPSPS